MPSRSKFGKVNLTGRSKIMRRNFTLKVDWSGSAPKIDRDSFSLALPEAIPSGSRVFIDANHRMNYHYFDLGTKTDMTLPEDLSMGDIGHNPITFIIRVVHPVHSGLLSARSAPYSAPPPDEKPRPKKETTFELLKFVPRDLPPGVPTKVEYPEIPGSSKPVFICVNKQECVVLWHALVEDEPTPLAHILPPYITAIAERLVSDALRDDFDPEEPITLKSSWQSHWNHLFIGWTDKGLGRDLEANDPQAVDDWILDILSHWSLMAGNPAKTISTSMGGF